MLMGLTRKEAEKIVDILENIDPDTPGPVLDALGIKMMALQTKLMNQIVNELGSIGAALERIAGRM